MDTNKLKDCLAFFILFTMLGGGVGYYWTSGLSDFVKSNDMERTSMTRQRYQDKAQETMGREDYNEHVRSGLNWGLGIGALLGVVAAIRFWQTPDKSAR